MMINKSKRIAIIGGGIVGATTAYLLSQNAHDQQLDLTLYDDGVGQATKAAAGIISPWISKRRNKRWYLLARDGAELIPQLARAINATPTMYKRNGTIITRDDPQKLNDLYQLALKRQKSAPAMGQVTILNSQQVHAKLPLLRHPLPGIFLSGGGQMNGQAFTHQLLKLAQLNGLQIKTERVAFNNDGQLKTSAGNKDFDNIIVASGPWLKPLLLPLHINADVRPQKGQLIELQTDYQLNEHMPVMMPEGERDFLPLDQHHFIIGATHENEMQFDLTPSKAVEQDLLMSAKRLIAGVDVNHITNVRVGTRAYTSDFGPFFGRVPGHPEILVASGLGSSGLTTGPMIGKILAEAIINGYNDWNQYTKSIQTYLTTM